jgi:hypothetical protein
MTGYKDNCPAEAIATIRRVLDENAEKHKPGHWRTIPIEDHIDHAQYHIEMYWNGSDEIDTEDHLAHALTRLALAVSVREAKK